MEIIDTHSHLYVEEFDADREAAVERCRKVGISRLYMPNIDVPSFERMMNMVHDYPGYCFPMLGLHPTEVGKDYKEQLTKLKLYLKEGHPFTGIGEIGLDFYWDDTFREEQYDAFAAQIDWANEWHLPIVIHSRKAMDETIRILEKHLKPGLRGVFHSFGGSLEEAQRLLKLDNFYLGINGVVTFKKCNLPDVLPHVPIERIVLETDCPYLTPVPYRGKRNESSYIIYTLKKVAEIYGKPEEEVARITSANALNLFKRVL
jgi:TatD DNase family protein